MGLYGIGKGLFKIGKGIVTGDVEKSPKEEKIAINVIAGEILDRIHTDEDEDDWYKLLRYFANYRNRLSTKLSLLLWKLVH